MNRRPLGPQPSALTELSYTHHRIPRPEGFEPPTHGLEGRCSVLLSYGRIYTYCGSRIACFSLNLLFRNPQSVEMVGARGFEPPTSASQAPRANHLRYAPIIKKKIIHMIDKTTSISTCPTKFFLVEG